VPELSAFNSNDLGLVDIDNYPREIRNNILCLPRLRARRPPQIACSSLSSSFRVSFAQSMPGMILIAYVGKKGAPGT
jgi:hypothetical protein